MASVKALESHTVHQIQSGQVIVDLCSVAKELLENSLDAGATTVEVRFRDYGVEAIEVQDNGSGIAAADYAALALKHHTSKLDDFASLAKIRTFGFRGEALSSLCAVSKLSVVTARADDAPRGSRLEFAVSGKLQGQHVCAAQKGTTVIVEQLFHGLPVRRRELVKHAKREYGKVISHLQAYACIAQDAKISVVHTNSKGKRDLVFATKSTGSCRDNIGSIFGAKSLSSLIELNMDFETEPTSLGTRKTIAV